MPKLLKDMVAEAPDTHPRELECRRIREIGENWVRDRTRVADLAHVPVKARNWFGDRIFNAICDAWEDADIRSTASAIHLEDKAVSRAVDALRTAKQALTDLSQEQREGLWWPISETERGVDRFFEWVFGAPEPTHRRTHHRGRRRGAVENPIFEKFVERLVEAAELSGGKLRHEKNLERSGPEDLIKALEILANHLPEQVAAELPSRSTLQRIKTRVRKKIKNVAAAGSVDTGLS